MPTYEYECRSCGHSFEAMQSMSDPALSECPECGRQVRRVLSGGMGVIFKGSGFYKNDARSPSSEGSAPKAAPSACASCPAAGGSCAASSSSST